MEDYVTFEQAKALKELGFDWEVYQYYLTNAIGDLILWFPEEGSSDFNHFDDGWFSAPTLYQAAKWLREKHNIIILVDTYFKNYMEGDYNKAEFEYVIVYMNFNAARKGSSKDGKLFESYEKALSAGIEYALESIKIN